MLFIERREVRGPRGVLLDAASNFRLLKWCKVSSTNRSAETLVGTKNANWKHACNVVLRDPIGFPSVCARVLVGFRRLFCRALLVVCSDVPRFLLGLFSVCVRVLIGFRFSWWEAINSLRNALARAEDWFLTQNSNFLQCPYSALTVPLQCPYSALYENTQCPYTFYF